MVHSVVKDIERAFPEAVVTESFTVADNATIELVNLFEATLDHERTQHLTTHPSRAVGHHWLFLEVVVLATVEFFNKVMGSSDIGNNRALESTDLGLVGVAAIEEDNLIALGLNKLVQLLGLKVNPATNDSVFVYAQVIGRAEGNNFISNFDLESWKIVAGTFGPLELGFLKGQVLLGGFDVLLDCHHVPTQGSINSVVRDQDTSL